MTTIGIVGAGADKFDATTERLAREWISIIISANPNATFRSGHSPSGGIDIWVEEECKTAGKAMDIKMPEINKWTAYRCINESCNALYTDKRVLPAFTHCLQCGKPDVQELYGFKNRNLDIAASDEVHVIVVSNYPTPYRGRMFLRNDDTPTCYHCEARTAPKTCATTPQHVKSGGCWTGIQALRMGNRAFWYVI